MPSIIKYLSALVLLLLIPLMFSSCYYMKQGRYLLSYHVKAQSVEKVLLDPATPEELKQFLLEVEDIRFFAREELGLKENKNYTTLSRTGQDFLAYVVSAAQPLALETYYWDYPVVGKAPYRGFYEIEDARKQAQKLKDQNFDVWVRQVDAFSTLGFLKDPLYDYMADYPIHRLAELIIHEQTHATLWIKNDSSFNEDLASFVGSQGARLFIESRFGSKSPELQALEAQKRDSKLYVEDIFRLRDQLNVLYGEVHQEENATGVNEALHEEYLRAKAQILSDFQNEFILCYNERYSSQNYLAFGELPVNNAYLELFQIYQGQEEWFRRLFEEEGRDMKSFLARIRQEKGE